MPPHRAVAAALAVGGLFLAVSPVSAQAPPPMSGLGAASRAGVLTVPANGAAWLPVETAAGLLGRALHARGYRPLAIGSCRRNRPRLVLCNLDLALQDSRWQGTGGVRLLRHGGARVRYYVLGVTPVSVLAAAAHPAF